MQPVILITGASSGIGLKAALELIKAGAIVYGGARHVENMQPIIDAGGYALHLDVTNDDSARSVVDQILDEQGRIDVLVNNAGYGSYGAVEDIPLEEAQRQLDVNLLGLARLTKLVLPSMRFQKSGKIINISSMAGKMWTPFGAWYHATKFAIEGFSDSLRLEVKPFGIQVILVEPGAIESNWANIAIENMRQVSGSGVYKEAIEQQIAIFDKTYHHNRFLTKSDKIATTIKKASLNIRPKTRYLTGYGAKISVALAHVLPNRWFDRISKKFM